jgi:thiol-disulfide isomerase/thioredoxin
VGHGSVACRRKGRAVLALAALVLAGCGAVARNDAPSAAQLSADYKGAPAPLAALHTKANKLLGGDSAAFRHELKALRGYPVVVNKWYSSCEDCQQEFSIFQRVAPRYGRTVAFLGDDLERPADGRAWLSKFPLSFPSYSDPTEAVAEDLGRAETRLAPVTYFYNRQGCQVYFHFGPYLSNASLEHDIRVYTAQPCLSSA